MKINYLRASTANSFDDCEFRFFLEYCIGFEGAAGEKAAWGSCIHNSSEILSKCRKTGHDKLKDKYTNPDYVMRICFNKFKKTYPQFAWSEKDYKFCRAQLQSILDSRWNPLKLKILDIEKQFEIEIKKPGCNYEYINEMTGETESGYLKLRGTIDLVTELDEDTIEIIDWKSGQRTNWIGGGPKEYDDFLKDIQLRVYDLATNIIYKKYKYRILTIFFTRDGGPFSVSFSEEDLKNTVDVLRRKFNEVLNTKMPKRLRDDRTRYKENFKCRFICMAGEKFKDKDGNLLCDKYYSILKNEGMEKGSKTLYNISIEGKSAAPISRRNDYSRSKIYKGTYPVGVEKKELNDQNNQ